MDSFAEPHKPTEYSLDVVRAQVHQLEEEHRAKGIPLTGRIIHVAHYLPITCAFSSNPLDGLNGQSSSQPGIPSPPQTPPAKAADIPPSPTDAAPPALQDQKSKWQLNVRYGHSAMVSGIASLAATHGQVFIGWTGDIHTSDSSSTQSESAYTKLSSTSITSEDKADLEGMLSSGKHLLKDELPEDKTMSYVPVWLEDKQAHGHYDGYCKQSECSTASCNPHLFLPCHRLTSLTFHFHHICLNLCEISAVPSIFFSQLLSRLTARVFLSATGQSSSSCLSPRSFWNTDDQHIFSFFISLCAFCSVILSMGRRC